MPASSAKDEVSTRTSRSGTWALDPATAAAAAAGAALASWLRVPVGPLIGALLAVLALSLASGRRCPVPAPLDRASTALIGALIGFRMPHDPVAYLQPYAAMGALAVLATTALSILTLPLLTLRGRVQPLDALVGVMPGAAVTMIALSEEMGADGRVVTLLQYMRMVLIILVIPWVASWLAPDTAALLPPPPAEAAPASPAALALGMVAVAGTCLAGSALAARLRFPAPTLAGPLVAAMVVNSLLPYDLYLPSWLAWIALAVKGARIGGQFDRPALARVRAAIPAALGQTGVLILACAGVGYAVHRLYRIDPLTALLATAPGALEAITATAYVLNADLALVTAIHLLRVLTMALVAPWCLRWLQPRIRASASPSSLRTTATSSRSARS